MSSLFIDCSLPTNQATCCEQSWSWWYPFPLYKWHKSAHTVLSKISRKTRLSFGVLWLQKMIHHNESSNLVALCPSGAQEAATSQAHRPEIYLLAQQSQWGLMGFLSCISNYLNTVMPALPEKQNWLKEFIFYMQTDVLKYSVSARNPPGFSHWKRLCESTREKPDSNWHTEWALSTRASRGKRGTFLQFCWDAVSMITLLDNNSSFQFIGCVGVLGCHVRQDHSAISPEEGMEPIACNLLKKFYILQGAFQTA